MFDDENIINPITKKSKNKLWYIVNTIIKSLIILLIIGGIMLVISLLGAELYIKDSYNRIEKNFKINFDLPASLTYEDICALIKESYIAYASIRYKHNLLNTKLLEELFTTEQLMFKLPKYIPDTNANISDFLEIVSGIKRMSNSGDSLEWFNIFNPSLNVRAIIDISDGQICTLFINGYEFTEVPLSLIKKLKKAIKKGTGLENIEQLQQKNKK